MTISHTKKIFSRFLQLTLLVAFVFTTVGTLNAQAAEVSLGVTQITSVRTSATADNTFESGWKWIFDVTVPLNETLFQMKFADWTNSASTLGTASNVRFYSSQASDAFDSGHAATLSQANTYGDAIHLDSTKDLDLTKSGRQVQISVETKVPSGTSGGSYSTSYGINTSHDPSIPVVAGNIVVSAGSGNPSAGTLEVLADSNSDGQGMLAFSLANSDSSDSNLSQLVFSVATSTNSGVGTSLNSLIYQANLIIGGITYPGVINSSGQIVFSNLGIVLPANQTKSGTVNLVFGPQDGFYSATQTSLSVSLVGNSTTVVSTSAATGLAANLSGSATGNLQTLALPFVEEPITLTKGTVSVSVQTGLSGGADIAQYTIPFTVTAGDNDIYIGANRTKGIAQAGNGVSYGTTTSSTHGATGEPTASFGASDVVTGDSSGNYFKVAANTTRTFTFAATLTATTTGATTAGYAGMVLNSVGYGLTSSLGSYYTSNLDTFKTSDVYITKR